MNERLKQGLIAAAVVAAAAEAAVIYVQWPAPPMKICASVELGNLLAAAARADADLRATRSRLRTDPDEALTKQIMSLEAASAAASNTVAIYKTQAQQRQKTAGAASREGSCS